jgi:hypothetical protein
VNGRALSAILGRFLSCLVRLTPRGRKVNVTARALKRAAGDSWAEISIRAPRARLGNRQLDQLLKAVGPMKLADVVTDLHRGELRVTVLSRLGRLRGGWFVIRQGVDGIPVFAIVCRGKAVAGR